MCIVGLGWGRATRTTRLAEAAEAAVTGTAAVGTGEGGSGVSVDAIATDDGEDAAANGGERRVAPIGEEDPDDVTTAADLFDPDATGQVVMLWILTPSIAAAASYLVFEYVPVF
jgi:PiT family inorganic phosphate transporter